jgi:hypothetical protein
MPEAYVTDFTNLGKYVKVHRGIDTDRAAYTVIAAEIAALMDDSLEEQTGLKNVLQLLLGMDSALDGYQGQLVSAAKTDIIQNILAADVDYVGSSKDVVGILEKLAEEMTAHSDTINGSAVAIGSPTYQGANTGTCLVALATATQLVGTEALELEVTSVPAAGSERWKVTGEPSQHGQLPTSVTTGGGATIIKDQNDQALFTVTITQYVAGTGYEITGDADGELGATTWAGAVKGTNTDASGDVFCVVALLSESEAGDNNNQLSGWANFTGMKLAVNTDNAGKVWVNIVDDGAGYFHVDIYKDTAKGAGNLVAHTATYNSTGAKALVADNTSGVGGTITIDAVTAADTDITCILAFRKVTVYKETGLSNIVAIGGLVAASGTVTLVAQNTSGLSGTAVIAYSDGEAKIQVRIGFALAVGDRVKFATTNDDAGKFAKFFRQELGVAVPVDLVAGETIADKLCE